MHKKENMSFLEQAWEEREATVYPDLFGETEIGIYPLNHEIFSKNFNQNEIDPTWLHYGVMKYPPQEKHKSWVYITSGMSNPWEAASEEEWSGLGMEFLLEAPDDSDTNILILLNLLAYNILLSCGIYGETPILDLGDRVPVKIEPNLTHLILSKPLKFPEQVKLVSGPFDILQVVGVTQSEWEFAKENSSEETVRKIANSHDFIINPNRESVV